MDFSYTQKTEELRIRVRTFMDDHIVPRLGQWNDEVHAGTYPVSFMDDLKALARSEGLDVTADLYPYRAGSTTLVTMLPEWAHVGGPAEILIITTCIHTITQQKNDLFVGFGGEGQDGRR